MTQQWRIQCTYLISQVHCIISVAHPNESFANQLGASIEIWARSDLFRNGSAKNGQQVANSDTLTATHIIACICNYLGADSLSIMCTRPEISY